MLTNDKVWLDGRVLALLFTSKAACFACAMLNRDGSVAKHTPTAAVGFESSCRIDLTNVPPGDYALAALTGGGPLAIGGALAQRRARRHGKRRGPHPEVVAKSSFAGAEGNRWALLYVDPNERTLRFRLSAADDTDAFLAALARPAKTIRFSVVAPCYNVARYLDDFFKSIVGQSLDFRSHIELIMVDDGSTDDTARVIRRWRKRYPKAIRYFRKENGGLSSARNYGMERVSHEWITFIDPDDFVDREYFVEVANAIHRHGEQRLAMVSCNLIRFNELDGKELDNHPLRYRFCAGERLVRANDLDRDIQLASNCAFIRKSLVAGLVFDGRIRPSFEDAHFNGRYLLAAGDRAVAFLPSARYLYRQRADKSSLVDSTKTHPEWYGDQIEFGCLALLSETAARYGAAPKQVQNTVLYELLWRFQHILDHPDVLSFLGSGRQRRFRRLLDQTFARIDVETIMDYAITTPEFSYKVGLLNLFKDCDPPRQVVQITDFDEADGLVRLVCWTPRADPGLSISVDNARVDPAYSKRRRRGFMRETFCWEHIAWVPVANGTRVSIAVDGRDVTVRIRGREAGGTVSVQSIRAALAPAPVDEASLPADARELRRLARMPQVTETFHDAWLFMDRDTEADDSAEHLYRWVRRHHPEINAFFVLGGNAPDWKRLEDEGFKLLTANAPEHAVALINARYVISSHADQYIHDRLPPAHFRDVTHYKFVFLQHGIIKDDISGWLNRYRINRFITTTPQEFEFVAGDGPFRFTRHEVVLTGLPRHDALLKEPVIDEHTIVFMPTWRLALAGEQIGATNKRHRNPRFEGSDYARCWQRIVGSPRLVEIASRCGYRIVFIPHKNLEPYIDAFRLPPQVEVRCFGGGPIAPVFRGLSLFVTDFTSKAFDVAYMKKPVMYYQFDRDFFLGGGHISRPGYFDYERDGFGPVFTEEGQLIAAIEAFMAGTAPDPVYRDRAEKTFPFRDGKCCERVFNAILDIERPSVPDFAAPSRLAV